MFAPADRVAIHIHGRWVEERIVRRTGDGSGVVASNGRTYPLDGGVEIGNTFPKTTLHAWDETTAHQVRLEQLRQRVLGIIVQSTFPPRGDSIASWTILELLGSDALTGTDSWIDEILRDLVRAGLIAEVPDLDHRYMLAQPAKKER